MSKKYKCASFLAFLGWYSLALLGSFSTSAASLSMGFMLIATLLVVSDFWSDIRRVPVVWLSGFLTLYILVRSMFALQTWPTIDEHINPHWTHFLRVTGLQAVPFGWWLFRSPRHIKPILITALVGLFLGLAWSSHWDWIMAGQFQRRFIWGQPNFVGMLSGSTILALLVWLMVPQKLPIVRSDSLWAFPLLVLCSFILYTTQSRAAWLALVISLLVLAVFLYYKWKPKASSLAIAISLGTGIICMIVVVLWYDSKSILLQRITEEWDTIKLVISGEWNKASKGTDSVNYHIQQWLTGLKAISQKPLFGWGPGSGMVILKKDNIPFGHFHNLYMEIFVGLGIFGTFLSAATALEFLRSTIKASKRGLLSARLYIGMFTITVFISMILMFQIRIGHSEGRAALTLLTSFYVLAVLKYSKTKNAAESSKF